MKKSYSELMTLPDYKSRLEYLYIGDRLGQTSFGGNRYLNQIFYNSDEWLRTRDKMLLRNEFNMGLEGYPLGDRWVLHHINRITKKDILERNDCLFDPENLVCVSHKVHNYIHFGTGDIGLELCAERKPFDTCPWKT